ncbi:hypothetical protein BS78_10G135600 [Paspalum vaginatum]|nr:hypothetical protein BS78_10G135600 [Paspalum vaginatum]
MLSACSRSDMSALPCRCNRTDHMLQPCQMEGADLHLLWLPASLALAATTEPPRRERASPAIPDRTHHGGCLPACALLMACKLVSASCSQLGTITYTAIISSPSSSSHQGEILYRLSIPRSSWSNIY